MKNYLLLIFAVAFTAMVSCTKSEDSSASISDASLSTMTTSDGLTLMRTTKPSDNAAWNIKMNDVAKKAYAEGLKNFPANSMIVKEKHDENGNITGFDVMYNAPADKNSTDGWLFTQLAPDGHVIYSTAERGMSCQSCHAADGQVTMLH